MKHVFLIAGVAVLAYAVFRHHRQAPVLGQGGGYTASQLIGGTAGPASGDCGACSTAAPSIPSLATPPIVAPDAQRIIMPVRAFSPLEF